MDAIDVTALRQLLIQHCDAVWVGLNVGHSMSSLGLRPAQWAVPIKRGTSVYLRQ